MSHHASPVPLRTVLVISGLLFGCHHSEATAVGTTVPPALNSPYCTQTGQALWLVDITGVGHGAFDPPFTSIQDAIDSPQVVDGDCIIVLPGTYRERIDLRPSGSSGSAKALRISASGAPGSTIIDAEQMGPCITIADLPLGEVVIANFRLINGSSLEGGGGVRCMNVDRVRIVDNIFEDCYSDRWGGGLSVENSAGFIRRNQFRRNIAGGSLATGDDNHRGGGLFAVASTAAGGLVIEENTFEENISGDTGGGVFLGAYNCVFQNNSVLTNRAWNLGGGIAMRDNVLQTAAAVTRINNNDVSRNQAQLGGGIYLFEPSTQGVLVNNNTFRKNTADVSGGGLQLDGASSPRLRRNRISYNISPSGAGLAAASVSVPRLSNCLFNRNRAGQGGAAILALEGATLEMRNCTLVSNRSAQGPLIWLVSGLGGTQPARLANCTIWDNDVTSPLISTVFEPVVDYCMVEGGTGATWFSPTCIEIDPMLAAGGDQTAASATIDAGDPAYVPGMNASDVAFHNVALEGPEFDLTGFERVQGSAVDMGCFEWPVTTVPDN